MSAGEIVGRLSAAKSKLTAAHAAVLAAMQAAGEAADQTAAALQGVGNQQLVAELRAIKDHLAASVPQLTKADDGIDRAIQRTQAIGGGH